MNWKFVLILAAIVVGSPAEAQNFGHFNGTVVVEWLNSDHRAMRLLKDFSYTDPGGTDWPAPEGSEIDGASIPRLAWTVIGSPFVGAYRSASVIHDVACKEKTRPWEAVHVAFYNAMRAEGVGTIKAKIMFAAVYHFGPRWAYKTEIVHYPELCVDKHRNCYPVPDPDNLTPTTVEVEIEPEPQEMSEAEFAVLQERIRVSEESGEPMSLVDIQKFR